MSARGWREFAVLESRGLLTAGELLPARRALEVITRELDSYVEQAGGYECVVGDVRAELLLQRIDSTLIVLQHQARLRELAPLIVAGHAAIEGRKRGGRSRSEPDWHRRAIQYAKTLLLSGTSPREIVGECVARYDKSDDAVRSVLQKHGVITRRKAAPSKQTRFSCD